MQHTMPSVVRFPCESEYHVIMPIKGVVSTGPGRKCSSKKAISTIGSPHMQASGRAHDVLPRCGSPAGSSVLCRSSPLPYKGEHHLEADHRLVIYSAYFGRIVGQLCHGYVLTQLVKTKGGPESSRGSMAERLTILVATTIRSGPASTVWLHF